MAASVHMRLGRHPVFSSNLLCCGQKLSFSTLDGSSSNKESGGHQHRSCILGGNRINSKSKGGFTLFGCLPSPSLCHPKRAFCVFQGSHIGRQMDPLCSFKRKSIKLLMFSPSQLFLSRGYARSRRQVEGWEAEGSSDMEGRSQASKEDSAWALRSSIENVFLSWVRNTYILTVAGVTVYTQMTVPLAEEAAVVLFLSGGINLATGSVMYIYNILSLRKRILMSRMGSLALSSLAGLHVLMWFGAIMLYLGYIEDEIIDIEEEIRKEEEITKQRRQRQRSRRYKEKYD